MERLKTYVKENKLYIMVMCLGFVLLLLQMKFIVLYADDMSLGIVAKKNNILGALNFLKENYMTWGGGPTPFIAIVFMWFDLKAWKIFNCLLILCTISLITKMISFKNKKVKPIVSVSMWLCVYILNIYISRETIYWLDGSLAYVLTTFQLVVYFYFMYSRIIMKTKERKYDFIIFPIIAFFSGWTGPQTGALTCLLGILLLLWSKFVEKNKIKIRYVIFYLFGILGFMVEYLAPGNDIRMQTFQEYCSMNFIERILYRVDSVWNIMFNYNIYKIASVPFYLFIIIGSITTISIKINKNESKVIIKNAVNIGNVVLGIFAIMCLVISLNINDTEEIVKYCFSFENLYILYKDKTLHLLNFLPYIITFLVLADVILLSIYIGVKKKEILLPVSIIAGIAGQMMMIFAPYTPLRAVYVSMVFLWMAIGYLIKLAIEEKCSIKYIIVLTILINNFQLGIASMIIALIIEKISGDDGIKKEILTIFILIGIIATVNYINVVYNYSINEKIYYRNVEALQNYDGTSREIYLEKPKEGQYGFNEMVGIDWIETAVKDYFNISQNVELKYINEK